MTKLIIFFALLSINAFADEPAKPSTKKASTITVTVENVDPDPAEGTVEFKGQAAKQVFDLLTSTFEQYDNLLELVVVQATPGTTCAKKTQKDHGAETIVKYGCMTAGIRDLDGEKNEALFKKNESQVISKIAAKNMKHIACSMGQVIGKSVEYRCAFAIFHDGQTEGDAMQANGLSAGSAYFEN